MFIRIFSDLHTEFRPFEFTPLEHDKDTVCILAGDIGVVNKPESLIDLLQKASNRFKAVVYVFGNHEFYNGGSLTRAHAKLKEILDHLFLSNLHILDNSKVIIDGTVFIGATLWTDYGKTPLGRMIAEQSMNDYRHIRTGPDSEPYKFPLTADRIALIHATSRKYVFDQVVEEKTNGNKVVVVVHHGVSDLSVSDEFKGDRTNVAFVSDLSNEILDTQPDLIVHGHVHRARDYTLGNTRVIVNPHGYPGERSGFNPSLIVEV